MQIRHEIWINAPLEEVWAITIDIENWHQWTPTVLSARKVTDEKFQLGSSAILKQPGLPETEWTVNKFLANNCFIWSAKVQGIFLEASHTMEKSNGGTKCTIAVRATGLPLLLFWPLLYVSLKRALTQENNGLKIYCEKGATLG